jgi:hypothetical protein
VVNQTVSLVAAPSRRWTQALHILVADDNRDAAAAC